MISFSQRPTRATSPRRRDERLSPRRLCRCVAPPSRGQRVAYFDVFSRSAVQLSVSCPGRRPRSRAAVAAAAARWSEKDRDLRPSCTCCAVVCRRAPPPTSSTKASTSVVTILPRYPRSNLKAVGAASVYCPLLNPQVRASIAFSHTTADFVCVVSVGNSLLFGPRSN